MVDNTSPLRRYTDRALANNDDGTRKGNPPGQPRMSRNWYQLLAQCRRSYIAPVTLGGVCSDHNLPRKRSHVPTNSCICPWLVIPSPNYLTMLDKTTMYRDVMRLRIIENSKSYNAGRYIKIMKLCYKRHKFPHL